MSNTDIYTKSFKIVFSKFKIRKAIFIAQIKAFDTLSSIFIQEEAIERFLISIMK